MIQNILAILAFISAGVIIAWLLKPSKENSNNKTQPQPIDPIKPVDPVWPINDEITPPIIKGILTPEVDTVVQSKKIKKPQAKKNNIKTQTKKNLKK